MKVYIYELISGAALFAATACSIGGSGASGSPGSQNSGDTYNGPGIPTLIGLGDKCVDVPNFNDADSTPLELWDCNQGTNQTWAVSNTDIIGLSNKCLDLRTSATADGTPIQLFPCNGSTAQQWFFVGQQLKNQNGKCVGVQGGQAFNGAALELQTCDGRAGQQWRAVGQKTFADAGGANAGAHGPRIYADASPWNTPIPAGVAYHDESVLHRRPSATSGDLNQHWYFGDVATYVSRDTDPVWTIEAAEHRGRPAQTIYVRGPVTMKTGPNADGTASLIDGTTAYDFWTLELTPDRGPFTARVPAWGKDDGVTGTGWGYGDPGHGGMNSGVRATNVNWGAGLITKADIEAGVIDHALAIMLTPDMLTPAHVAPAIIEDNFGADNGPIPSGARVFIPADSPKPAGLSPVGEMFWTAMQRYGAYVTDSCLGAWPFFSSELGIAPETLSPLWVFWNGPGQTDNSDIGKISPYFRVVNFETPTVYHY